MNFVARIKISGEEATVGGARPFRVIPADRSGALPGFVMIDMTGTNCVRYRKDLVPVIFTDQQVAAWMALDFNARRA